MIEAGVIDDLLCLLEDKELNDLSTEASTGILMNLLLRTLGKTKCLKNPTHVLKVLSDHLENENPQVRTYINGSLYTLLSDNRFKSASHEIGLEEMLHYSKKNSAEIFVSQIDFILEQFSKNEEPHQEDLISEDGIEEDDIDEEEEIEIFKLCES
jgi:hypothetical protein